MCLIVYSPKSQPLPADWVSQSATRNKDGFGVMWPEGGRIKTFKGLVPLERQQAVLAEIAAKNVPFAMHQRMATHGAKTPKMCHPFKVLSKEHQGQDLYMMHNGVISKMKANKDRSDTWLFVNDFLRPILAKAPNLLQKKPFQEMLADYIGTGSKLLFMDGEGRVTIINKTAGTDREGFWLSNTYSIYTSQSNYNYNNGYNGRRHYHSGMIYGDYGDSDYWEGEIKAAVAANEAAAATPQTQEGSKSADGVQPALPGTPPPPAKQDVPQANETDGKAAQASQGQVIPFVPQPFTEKPPLAKVEVSVCDVPKTQEKRFFLNGLLDWYVPPPDMSDRNNRVAVLEAIEKSSREEILDWVVSNADTVAAFLYHHYSGRLH